MAGVAAIVGAVSAATSAGVSIYGAATADAPAGGVSVPRGFDMPNKAQSAMAAFQGIQNLPGQNIPGQVTPQYEQIAQQLVNNPYAQMLMQGANSAAPFGQNAALDAYGVGQQATAAGGALVPYANQIAQTAFDPQNALYAQLQQRTVDQARAGQAARPHQQTRLLERARAQRLDGDAAHHQPAARAIGEAQLRVCHRHARETSRRSAVHDFLLIGPCGASKH